MFSILKTIEHANEKLAISAMKLSDFILILVTIGTLIQVVLRYFFGAGIGWIDELSSYSLLWISFLVAPYLTLKKQHVAVDMLPKMLKEKHYSISVGFELLINAIIIYGVYWSLIGMYGFVQSNLTVYAAMLPIKLVYVYAIAPISLLFVLEIVAFQSLMAIFSLRQHQLSKALA